MVVFSWLSFRSEVPVAYLIFYAALYTLSSSYFSSLLFSSLSWHYYLLTNLFPRQWTFLLRKCNRSGRSTIGTGADLSQMMKRLT
ncbi:hypothetical protein CKAN_02203000 [Cinnamomum micranthum f. kanehirae]|uniref:Uncharacterized protein n=1 Tax=Cinnamomum micranthum f. kanehirae TaxID=337451 RepID=A0A443PQ00_9MAGN|nr:hypothetical protein CKAN_02203000 [Cinnamomum micranthum f. kanehirae]